MARGSREDWAALLDDLSKGDRRALVKLTRLINGFFRRWNAYDFRDDWEDLIQEILFAVVRAHEEGRVRERAHVYGFIKTVARNKFVDRLKGHLRSPASKSLPWEEMIEGELDDESRAPEPGLARDVEAALAGLEDRRRRAILAVYLEGKTHQEASRATRIPVGSLRRYLREGLAELQRVLEPAGHLDIAGISEEV